MVRIDNHSGLPHLLYEKAAPSGERFDVLVLRGTFDFARDGEPMALATEQRPILLGDRYDGPVSSQPLKAVIAEEGDLVLGKPGTDVLMQGHLRPRKGTPTELWQAELSLGSLSKTIRVNGPREIRDSLTGWRLGEATPVEQVPLDYRLAYGGCFYDPEAPAEGAQAASVHYPMNAAGCGWLPSSADFKRLDSDVRQRIEKQVSLIRRLPAPQLEDPLTPYKDPHQKLTPQGFGPIARWWEPRVSLQGTFDEQWQQHRSPLLPADFDPRFYQSAPASLVATPYLGGDEIVRLKGCLVEGECSMRLPSVAPMVLIDESSPSGHAQLPPLDTVRIDLDRRQATLLWRLPLAQQAAPRRLSIGLVAVSALQTFGKKGARP